MAALDFGGLCTVRRTDEIGILASSLNDLSGKLSSALSELQSANKQLQADIDRERELERQRIDFFSAASHELKTPITIIKGQLQGMLYQVGHYKDRETYLAESLAVTDTLEKMVQLLQKVLDNLLGNAAVYSPAGNCIFVKLWRDTEKVKLTIENTGVHIQDGDIPKLFEAFYRVDQSRKILISRE